MTTPKLSINPIFDYSSINHAKERDVYMDIVLEAPERVDQKRVPLHLILALDVSGSMSGSKLESVKQTVFKLIDNVTENDTIGMLSFNGSIKEILPALPMSSDNKTRARDSVNRLYASGMTNLGDAMCQAMERAVIPDKKKISRIVLLTDGCPTSGTCDHEGLSKMVSDMNHSVSMSTFGYGADYDAELMTSISKLGRGNSFYIDSDEACKKGFAMELGGLLSLYAQDIKVEFSPSNNFKVKEFMSDYEHKVNKGYRGLGGTRVSFTVDDIYFGEKKHVIIKLTAPKASSAVCTRPTTVCKIEAEYLHTESKENETAEGTARIQYVKSSRVQKTADAEVKKQVAMIKAARFQKEAKEKADKGDFEGAKMVLNSGIDYVKGVKGAMGSVGVAVMDSFRTTLADCSDQFTYSSIGSKKLRSNIRGLTMNRASSADSMAYSYSNEVTKGMVTSFLSPNDSNVSINVDGSGTGTDDGTTGTDDGKKKGKSRKSK